MKVATGTYTGDGNDNHDITGVGFRTNFVQTNRSTSGTIRNRWGVSSGAADLSYKFIAAVEASDWIQAFSSDGFQVGADASVNNNTTTYGYGALGIDARGDMAVGSYVPDGNDNYAITGLSFQPDFVIIKRGGAAGQLSWFSSKSVTAGTSYSTTGAATTTGIKSFTSDGFTVGTHAGVNSAGVTFYYMALKENTGVFKSGSFTGDGVGQSITAVAFQPELLWVFNADGVSAIMKASFSVTTASHFLDDTNNNIANGITSLDANGFTVGDAPEANENLKTMVWLAWNKTSDQPALPAGPANLKSYNTNLKANIKSMSGNLIANIKSLSGNS